jgi:hypothetical protein
VSGVGSALLDLLTGGSALTALGRVSPPSAPWCSTQFTGDTSEFAR